MPDDVLVVERIELRRITGGNTVTVHAGGQAFKPWEIERVMGWSGAA